jgi:hypothetical protein
VIPLDYLAFRLLRRAAPAPLMEWALQLRLGVVSGMETRLPEEAAQRYVDALAGVRRSLEGASVLVFGYGGSFGLPVALLRRGARHVVLCDPYAVPNRSANRELAAQAAPYLRMLDGEADPDPGWITMVHGDVRAYAARPGKPVDLVLSSSVYEHLEDPEGVTAALAQVTALSGYHLHFIDLRDHFFKYPFEMLCHAEADWQRFLNPPSYLNRYRVGQYEAVFRRHFAEVRWEALSRDPQAFGRAKARLRPEFLTGDDNLDAVTRIVLYAGNPKQPRQGA